MVPLGTQADSWIPELCRPTIEGIGFGISKSAEIEQSTVVTLLLTRLSTVPQ